MLSRSRRMSSSMYERWSVLSCLLASIILFEVFESNAEKINERRILLPYNSGVPTNFTLQALTDTACYKWSSSRPDIASVKHTDNPSCARQATITVVSTVPKRQSTVITAHDLKTNLQIRCDVEIDVIDRVVITTTTREIVYGELPETIKVVAFNDKNDTFTSIGGVQFDWAISPTDILRYRTWASSSYASPDFVEFWESRGAKSSYVLVEGVRTGSAKVRARILGDAYQDVEPAEIAVHVVANLLLIPSNDVFLVRGSKVVFRAEISKQGPRVPLNLPLPQYSLEVTEPNIAQFDEFTNQLEALEEGHTSLVLRDRNIDSSEASHTSTDVHVMPPAYLALHVTPGDSFQLRNETVYVIEITLHDDWHHRLYLSDNINITLKLSEKYFEVLESTSNGTYHVVRTHKTGATKLRAQFHGAGEYVLDRPLEHVQEVAIYPPITLTPSEIYLPWLPKLEPDYTVYVEATGASGQYNWETANESQAVVKASSSRTSRATIFTKGQGDTEITCTDAHNSLLFNQRMTVRVRPIEALEILPSIVETQLGGSIVLPIAVVGYLEPEAKKHKFYFDDCEKVQFEVEIVEKNRVRHQVDTFTPGLGPRSCRSLTFECLASGPSLVWIRHRAAPDRVIETAATVGCFKPLKLIHPDEFAVLSLGAKIDVAFEGGPRPWQRKADGFYTKATPSEPNLVKLVEIRDRYRFNKDLHIFRVECLAYGETRIDLEVGNSPSATLPNPASTFASVNVRCARPETLIVRPVLKPTCPLHETLFTLEKGKDIDLLVQVLDSKGHQFYNFSTLHFEWAQSGNAVFEESTGVKEEVNGAHGYPRLTRSYQIVKGLSTPKTRVLARVIGYKGSNSEQFDVRRDFELFLTDAMVSSEETVSILKHSSYKKTISIERGSGYFSIDWTTKPTISVEVVKSNSRQFEITPNQIGNGVITITDLCLDLPPLSLPYSVVEAVEVRVSLVDKIQLGATVEGFFIVMDNRGNRLPTSFHTILEFGVVALNSFLTVSDLKPMSEFQTSFKVKAERLGLAKIIVQSQSDKVRSLQSHPIDVQIFSPLLIIPSNITLIVGGHFQPTFIGGPQTQGNIEFSLANPKIASTASSSNGVIVGLRHGKTKLTARVLSVDGYEYSSAEVEVHVAPLRKVKIYAPTSRLLVGTHMPLYLIGSSGEHETPFMFGQAVPSLKMTWSLSNQKIGSLESSFQKYGIIDSKTDQFATRFLANSIGSVSLKVQVQVLQPASEVQTEQLAGNQPLSDTIQLQVLSDFALSVSSIGHFESPSPVEHFRSKVLLLSPGAELSLHALHLDSVKFDLSKAAGSQVRLVNQTDQLILQAGKQLESAVLNVQRDVHRTGLLQYYTYSVHVEKVRYLSLEFFESEHSNPMNANLDVFPVGSEIALRVNFYDSLGRRFDSVKSSLKWTLSRNDVITVLAPNSETNSIIRIRSVKQGVVTLHVVDQVNQVEQFYRIEVGSVIEPRTLDPITVTVGDVYCFRTRLSTEPETDGLWSLESRDPVGHISPTSGVFAALNPGKALIGYNHTTSGLATFSNVQVKPFGKLSLNIGQLPGVTTTSKVVVPVNWISNSNSLTTTASVGCSNVGEIVSVVRTLRQMRLLPYTCDVSVEGGVSLWEVDLEYIPTKNYWACVLTPKKGLNMEDLAMLQFNVTVTVMSNLASTSTTDLDPYLDPLGMFHQVTLPFLPAFYTTLKQLILTSDSKEVKFTLHSVPEVLKELSIKSSNDDILEVRKLAHESALEQNSLKVLVILRNADIFSNDVSNLHLLLHSTLTNQTERLPVQIKLYGTLAQLPAQIFTTHFYYYATMSLTTMMVAFVIYLMITRMLQGVKGVGGAEGGGSVVNGFMMPAEPSNSPFRGSPRVIDYSSPEPRSNLSTSAGGGIAPSFSGATSPNPLSRLFSPNAASSPANNPGSPSSTLPAVSSPRVGRALYSTRQFYQS